MEEVVKASMLLVGTCTLSSITVVGTLWCRNDYKLMLLLATACSLIILSAVTGGIEQRNYVNLAVGIVQAVAIYFLVLLGKKGFKYVKSYSLGYYDLVLIFEYLVHSALGLMVLCSALNMSGYLKQTGHEEVWEISVASMLCAICLALSSIGGYMWALTHSQYRSWDRRVFYTQLTLKELTCEKFVLEDMTEVSPGTHYRGTVIFRDVRFPMEMTVTMVSQTRASFSYKVAGLEAYLTEPYRTGFEQFLMRYYQQYMAYKRMHPY